MADEEHARVHELENEIHERSCREEHERLEERIRELEAELASLRSHEHDHEDLEEVPEAELERVESAV